MGKPFKNELDSLENTYDFTISANIDELKKTVNKTLIKPLYIIGSGGSLSACFFAEMLHQEYGILGKAITPLESFYIQKCFQQANVLIVTAGGRNKDILFAFDQAITMEPDSIISLCTTLQSPLATKAKNFSLSSTFEFPLPSGKDGFLATNSLLAFFVLLARSYNCNLSNTFLQKGDLAKFENEIEKFLAKLDVGAATFKVL